MSGGTWQTQNKIRAGAYINFKAVNQDSWNPNDRNIMTMPVKMDWGVDGEIIKLTADQLLDGSCEKIIGYNAADKESLVFRKALENCYTALIYRLNCLNGKKAYYETLNTLGEYLYKMEAKYTGICGNKISFKVIENASNNTLVELITYYRGMEKDHQIVSRVKSIPKMLADGELVNNDWINIIPVQKQPYVTISGNSYFLDFEANSNKYVGEEGNNLKAGFQVVDDLKAGKKVGLIKLYDDQLLLEEIKLPVETELVADQLPVSENIVFKATTRGKIASDAGTIAIKAFNTVYDPRLQLEAGATLANGENGASVTSEVATAKWGGLLATAKKPAEEGNNYEFAIQEDNDEITLLDNDELPFILKANLLKFNNLAEAQAGITRVKIIKKDSADETTYKFNRQENWAIVQKFESAIYDREWKIPEIQFEGQGENIKIEVEAGYIDRVKHPDDKYQQDGCGIYLNGSQEGRELVVGLKTLPSGEIEQVAYPVIITVPIAKMVTLVDEPLIEDCKLNIQETDEEIDQFLEFKLITEHNWNKDETKLFDESSWQVISSLKTAGWAVRDMQIDTSDPRSLLFNIVSPSGIKAGEVISVELEKGISAFIDKDSQIVTLKKNLRKPVLEGVGEKPVEPLFISTTKSIIEIKTKQTEFTTEVSLSNHLGRYVFNDYALQKDNWYLYSASSEHFSIVSIEKITEVKLKVTFKFDGVLPYVKNDLVYIGNLESEIVRDTFTEVDVQMISSGVVLQTYEEQIVVEPKWKIVINDTSQNGTTVAVLKGLLKKYQIEELIEKNLLVNDYILFEGSGTLTPTLKAIQLSGGTSSADLYTSENGYFAQVKGQMWNCMALPQEDGKDEVIPARIKKIAVELIENLREKQGIKCQLVLYNFGGSSCNYEGVISTKQGFKTAEEEINAGVFTAYVAGLTAGASFNKSNTFKVVDGATEVIYYNGEKPYTNEDYIEKLKQGHFLLTKRRDLSIVCEKDQNTLHEPYPTNDVNYSFTKNRVIRTLDEINNTVVDIWESRFVGKVTNNEKGRTLYRTALINYIAELERLEAVQNFNPQTDITVVQGEKIDAVVVTLAIQPTDAMEKLYMTVNIN